MKSELSGARIFGAKSRGIYVVPALCFVALIATGCTGTSQDEAAPATEPNATQDLPKEDRTPEKKELPEDLAPLEISIPEPGDLGDPKEEVKKAEAVVSALINVTGQIAERADGQSEGLEKLTEGFVKGELEAMAFERWQMGVKQTGTAKIVSVSSENIDLQAEPARMDIHVCLDLHGIDVVDENGNSFEGLLYKPAVPVLNSYGAIFTDGQWKITTHTIPEDSACKDASSKED